MASIALPLVLASIGLSNDGGATFAPPVRLMADGAPMGEAQLYPSPSFFDLDGDGVLELVVGDLVGNLMVSRRLAGENPLAWSRAEPLLGADKQPLKFHNW